MIALKWSGHMTKPSSGMYLALSVVALFVCTTPGCTVISEEGVAAPASAWNDDWDVQWNPTLGTPSRMTNRSVQGVIVTRTTPAVTDTVGEAAVRGVFRQHAEWFQMRPGIDELVVSGSRVAEGFRYVRFQQMYRGLPVAGADCEARVYPSGRVGSIEGRFHPHIEVSVTPVVDEHVAESRANALIVNGVTTPDLPSVRFDVERNLNGRNGLVVVPGQHGMVLAWSIMIQNEKQERARIYVNAATGETIGRQPITGTWMH